MARYIDAEQVVRELLSLTQTDGIYGRGLKRGIDLALAIVNRQDTADVEQVVYCKDCEWSVKRVTNNEIFPYQCLNTTACGKPRRALDFCSCGERRKDNEL